MADHEVDHSHSSSMKVKIEWIYNSTPNIYLHVMVKDNFNFLTYFMHRTSTQILGAGLNPPPPSNAEGPRKE